MRRRSVTQCDQLSAFPRAHGKPLFRSGPLAGGIEHLRTRKSQLDGSLYELRRSRRKQCMAPLKSLRAKRAADERTNDPHVLLWHAECVRNDSLQLFDPARALVNE